MKYRAHWPICHGNNCRALASDLNLLSPIKIKFHSRFTENHTVVTSFQVRDDVIVEWNLLLIAWLLFVCNSEMGSASMSKVSISIDRDSIMIDKGYIIPHRISQFSLHRPCIFLWCKSPSPELNMAAIRSPTEQFSVLFCIGYQFDISSDGKSSPFINAKDLT